MLMKLTAGWEPLPYTNYFAIKGAPDCQLGHVRVPPNFFLVLKGVVNFKRLKNTGLKILHHQLTVFCLHRLRLSQNDLHLFDGAGAGLSSWPSRRFGRCRLQDLFQQANFINRIEYFTYTKNLKFHL